MVSNKKKYPNQIVKRKTMKLNQKNKTTVALSEVGGPVVSVCVCVCLCLRACLSESVRVQAHSFASWAPCVVQVGSTPPKLSAGEGPL